MRYCLPALATMIAVLFATPTRCEKSGSTEIAVQAKETELEGQWIILSWAEGDNQFKELAGSKVVIEKNKISVFRPDRIDRGTFRVDPTRNPKHIDLIDMDEEIAGIYALDKDSLKICFPNNSKEVGRPKEFVAKGIVNLVVLKRSK